MAPESSHPENRTELPNEFAHHAAAVTGLDEPPATLEEWWVAVADQYAAEELTVGRGDLYSETPTRHEVRVDGRIRYANCALDALQAAAMESESPVTVRSVDPVSAAPVTITVGEDDPTVSPEGALVCFGSTIDVDDVEAAGSLAAWSLQDDESEIRGSVCRYTNAFESEETYEAWAAESESVSAPLPPENVVALMGAIPTEPE